MTLMADDTEDLSVPPATGGAELASDGDLGGEGWSGADIEDAYRKALEAMEDIPWQETVDPDGAPLPADQPPSEPGNGATAVSDPRTEAIGSAASSESSSVAGTTGPGHADSVDQPGPARPVGPRLAAGTRPQESELDAGQRHVSRTQIIEAALFVGGGPLTAKKICALLRGSFDSAFVERSIDELNDAYAAQGRPYDIRLGDGGYRLELRAEYDRLRHRVFGSGPREVRLSQDVLEVLALVAYQQPISQADIESHGKQNAGNLLRQLLRRDLIAFERGTGGRKDVRYHTTARFLSVFGLGSLEELPQAEDLAKK